MKLKLYSSIRLLTFCLLMGCVISLVAYADEGTLKWYRGIGKVSSSPAIGLDGTIYVGSYNGFVYALNPNNGVLKWLASVGASVPSSPAIGSDGIIYVGSLDSRVYALNPDDGSVKWKSNQTGGEIYSSPAIGSDGTIYVGSYDGYTYALNLNGTFKWTSNQTGDGVHSSPAIGSDGTIYVGSLDNNIYALNPNDGSIKWNFPTGGSVYSSPAIGSDGTIYVGSYDGYIYALNPDDGSIKWHSPTGNSVYSSPAIGSDGTIYVGSYDGYIYALNPDDGSIKWKSEWIGKIYSSPAIGSDGVIYVGSSNKKVYALNPDGSLKWTYSTGGEIWSSPAIISDGTIYVGANNGFYALTSTSQGLADSSWPKFHHDNQNTGRIGISSLLVVDAGIGQTICHPNNNGGKAQIGGNPTASGGTPPYTYSWTPTAGLDNPNIANPIASPATTTTYTVTVTDQSVPFQEKSDSVTITVNQEVIANAGEDKSINPGESITIGGNPTVSGGTPPYTYSWQPTDTLDNPTGPNPTATPTATTTYTVTVTDAIGCPDTDEVKVSVVPTEPTVTVINPNGGEILKGGTTYDITWIATGSEIDHIKLLYSTDSGGTYPNEIESSTENDGIVEWSVPNIDSTQVRVKAIAEDINNNLLAEDESDNDFTITPPSVIKPVADSPQLAGTEFTVDIRVENVENLFGLSFVLHYTHNTDYIDALSAEKGDFLGSDVIFYYVIDDAQGIVSIGIVRQRPADGVDGSGVVAKVTFQSEPETPDGTLVDFTITDIVAKDPSETLITLTPGSETVEIRQFCVWPGDNDNDGKVDQADVLPIGFHWEREGPPRSGAPSCAWECQPVEPWEPEAATYADANGDGIVNHVDISCIGLNWELTHDVRGLALYSIGEVQDFIIKPIVIRRPLKNQFTVGIKVERVSNLFGIAFALKYANRNVIKPLSVGAGDFLGSDIVSYDNVDDSKGVIRIGISRKHPQSGVSGSGIVAKITFQSALNLPEVRMIIKEITAIDADGKIIPFGGTQDTPNNGEWLVPLPQVPAGASELAQNFPNPFNPETWIPFQLKEAADVTISIYDASGKVIRIINLGEKPAGFYTSKEAAAYWDGRNTEGEMVASGVYFYAIRAGKFFAQKKMIIVR